MTLVVINKCYGGFGLSHEAVMKYAKRKKMRLYAFINGRKEDGMLDFDKWIPYDGKTDTLLVHYAKKPIKSSKGLDASYFSLREISRDDPDLVAVVKEMGNKANGQCAKLGIVKIPDDVKWEISEYDGMENVSEAHRNWY